MTNTIQHSAGQLSGELAGMLAAVQQSVVQVHNGQKGSGAGITWQADGKILTNNHVARSNHPTVELADGRIFEATVISRDPDLDLALLHIPAKRLIPAVWVKIEKAFVGELLFAVGHPWGQPGYVTSGILSGWMTAQTQNGIQEIRVIRTDVKLAPGNSGGPLVNSRGEIVGINTMIFGGDQSVAIPAQLADKFIRKTKPI